MRVFAISGYSGTGKTSLVEQIIKALSEQGYVVVTAKSSMHDAKDIEGTDTWRHMQAGAKTSTLLGPHNDLKRNNRGENLQVLFAGTKADFLIVEGMKKSKIPKIWCIGDKEVDRDHIPESTKAVVGWASRDTLIDIGIPFLKSSEIGKIIDIIKQEAIELPELGS
jgi:molybdopterin-guanine dinucleotide biosynthesis protein B